MSFSEKNPGLARSYNPHNDDFYPQDVYPYPPPPAPKRTLSLKSSASTTASTPSPPPPPYAGAAGSGWTSANDTKPLQRSGTLSSQLSRTSTALGDIDDMDYAPDPFSSSSTSSSGEEYPHSPRRGAARTDIWAKTRWGPDGPAPGKLHPDTLEMFLDGELRYVDNRGSERGARSKTRFVRLAAALAAGVVPVAIYLIFFAASFDAGGFQYAFALLGTMWLVGCTLCSFAAYTAHQWNPLDVDVDGDSPPIAYWPITGAYYLFGTIIVVTVVESVMAMLLLPSYNTPDDPSSSLKLNILYAALLLSVALTVVAQLVPRGWDAMMRWNTEGFESVPEAERGGWDPDAADASTSAAEWFDKGQNLDNGLRGVEKV